MPTPTPRGSSSFGEDPFTHRAHFQTKRGGSKCKQREHSGSRPEMQRITLARDQGQAWMAPGGGGGAQLLGSGLGLEAVCAGPGSGARWRLAPDPQAWNALCTHTHPSLCGPGGGMVRLPHPPWPQVSLDLALLGPGTPAGQGRSDGQREGKPSPSASELPASRGLSPGGPSGVRPADASVCRGCEETRVPPDVLPGGTPTPNRDGSLRHAPWEGPGRPSPRLHTPLPGLCG